VRSATTALDEKIEAKRLKLEQLKVQQMRLENRLQAIATRQARREDTRRKILIGTTILAKIERGEFEEKKLRAMLDEALVRKDDRKLFEL
jgi:predicted  nucleic acid-binding Zn-ribbon protein